MQNILKTQGQRIRYIAEEYFGGISAFAAMLGMKPPSLYGYLNDETQIGKVLKKKLEEGIGISPNWIEYGSGSVFAENEKGRELAAKHTAPSTQVLPEWVRDCKTSVERVQKVVDVLGGSEQAETILSITHSELHTAITSQDTPLSFAKSCSKIGFSLDWILFGISPFNTATQEGVMLRKAVETNTTEVWSRELFRARTIGQKQEVFAADTIGKRLLLVRIWLCQMHGIADTAASFADFLTHSPYNTKHHIFASEDVKAWETEQVTTHPALLLVAHYGINLNWLMLGLEQESCFLDNSAGRRMEEWHKARSLQGAGTKVSTN
jgi:hypothetical protein